MTLIDKTYFQVEPLYIPNAVNNTPGIAQKTKADKDSYIDLLIVRREKEYLKELLGLDLYTLFMAGLAEVSVAQKWVDLKAQIVDETNKISPIANYVYFFYLRQQKTTDVGIVRPKVENAEIVSSAYKQCDTWNDMVELNYEICQWLIDNSTTYETETVLYPLWVEDEGLLKIVNTFGI